MNASFEKRMMHFSSQCTRIHARKNFMQMEAMSQDFQCHPRAPSSSSLIVILSFASHFAFVPSRDPLRLALETGHTCVSRTRARLPRLYFDQRFTRSSWFVSQLAFSSLAYLWAVIVVGFYVHCQHHLVCLSRSLRGSQPVRTTAASCLHQKCSRASNSTTP